MDTSPWALQVGNISTCVEQIKHDDGLNAMRRKHLHMRGADALLVSPLLWLVETSPHAWSRFGGNDEGSQDLRNISTCVEQIVSRFGQRGLRQKHLHMRGADFISGGEVYLVEETSPHAWSR